MEDKPKPTIPTLPQEDHKDNPGNQEKHASQSDVNNRYSTFNPRAHVTFEENIPLTAPNETPSVPDEPRSCCTCTII